MFLKSLSVFILEPTSSPRRTRRFSAVNSRAQLASGLLQLFDHLVDIVLIRGRRRKCRLQDVGDDAPAIDHEPVWIVLHPTSPPQSSAGNAVDRRRPSSRVRKGRGENQAFLLAEWPFAAAEKPVLFFERPRSMGIQGQYHEGVGPEFFDLVLPEAQLRLLVHSAPSAVEGGEVDGDGFLAENRGQFK